MSKTYKPTLCFGTFFVLLSQARKNLGARKKDAYSQDARTRTEKEVFEALQGIVFGYKWKMSSSINPYKSCTKYKTVPCQSDSVLMDAFNSKFEASDEGLFKSVRDDIVSLLEKSRFEMLAKALIELISIAVDAESGMPQIDSAVTFLVDKGEAKTKTELLEATEINLPYFLLSVYHYILNSCTDNTIGEETYKEWCPSTNGSNTQRQFKNGFKGTSIAQTIAVCCVISENQVDEPTGEISIEKEAAPSATESAIQHIQSLSNMATLRKYLLKQASEIADEICAFATAYMSERNNAELRKLCVQMIADDRTEEALFDTAIRKLADGNQNEFYKVLDKLFTSDEPVFRYYFDELDLLNNQTLKGRFLAEHIIPAKPTATTPAVKLVDDIDNEYYNLVVTGFYDPDDASFNRTRIVLQSGRALEPGYTSPDILALFGVLNDETIEIIKRFPSIIAFESRLGECPEQEAYYGFITDIKIRENGVHLYFRKVGVIPQKKLHELEFPLALHKVDLMHTHWAIKKVDLIEELNEAGIVISDSIPKVEEPIFKEVESNTYAFHILILCDDLERGYAIGEELFLRIRSEGAYGVKILITSSDYSSVCDRQKIGQFDVVVIDVAPGQLGDIISKNTHRLDEYISFANQETSITTKVYDLRDMHESYVEKHLASAEVEFVPHFTKTSRIAELIFQYTQEEFNGTIDVCYAQVEGGKQINMSDVTHITFEPRKNPDTSSHVKWISKTVLYTENKSYWLLDDGAFWEMMKNRFSGHGYRPSVDYRKMCFLRYYMFDFDDDEGGWASPSEDVQGYFNPHKVDLLYVHFDKVNTSLEHCTCLVKIGEAPAFLVKDVREMNILFWLFEIKQGESCLIRKFSNIRKEAAFVRCLNLTNIEEDMFIYGDLLEAFRFKGVAPTIFLMFKKIKCLQASADATSLYELFGSGEIEGFVSCSKCKNNLECIREVHSLNFGKLDKTMMSMMRELLPREKPAVLINLRVTAKRPISSYSTDKLISAKTIHLSANATVSEAELIMLSDCTNIKSYTVEEKNPRLCSVDGMLCSIKSNTIKNKLLKVPMIHEWLFVVPDSVDEIGGFCLRENSSVKKIIIHADVVFIHDNAFSGCQNLCHIVLESCKTQISKLAFADCPSLGYIEVSDAATDSIRKIAAQIGAELIERGDSNEV